MRLGKANMILISKSNATIAYIKYKWITYKHLITQQYIIMKITTLVFTIKCTEWQFTAPKDSGQRPSSNCHRVCLRLEWCRKRHAPFSYQHATGTRNMLTECSSGFQRMRRDTFQAQIASPQTRAALQMCAWTKLAWVCMTWNHIEITYKFNDQT